MYVITLPTNISAGVTLLVDFLYCQKVRISLLILLPGWSTLNFSSAQRDGDYLLALGCPFFCVCVPSVKYQEWKSKRVALMKRNVVAAFVFTFFRPLFLCRHSRTGLQNTCFFLLRFPFCSWQIKNAPVKW